MLFVGLVAGEGYWQKMALLVNGSQPIGPIPSIVNLLQLFLEGLVFNFL